MGIVTQGRRRDGEYGARTVGKTPEEEEHSDQDQWKEGVFEGKLGGICSRVVVLPKWPLPNKFF